MDTTLDIDVTDWIIALIFTATWAYAMWWISKLGDDNDDS